MSSDGRFEVSCEQCLFQEVWSEFRLARLQYGFHEDHHGSEMIAITADGTEVST